MATWKTVQIVSPAALDPLVLMAQQVDAVVGNIYDAAETALNAVNSLAVNGLNQFLFIDALLAESENVLNDFFSTGAYQIIVHPWTPGVGQGTGPMKSLSFPNAVSTVIREFDDQYDRGRPQFSSSASIEMLTIAAGGASPDLFKNILEQLLALFDFSEIRLALRRIIQSQALEKKRYERPGVSREPNWKFLNAREFIPGAKGIEAAGQGQLSMLRGYNKAKIDSTEKLIDKLLRKKNQLIQVKASWDNALALFLQQPEGVKILKVSGVGGTRFLQDELRTAKNAPGHEISNTIIISFVGGTSSLSTLSKILGVADGGPPP